MFLPKSILVILTNLIIQSIIVSSKCVYTSTENDTTAELNFVVCRYVQSMHDLTSEMTSNWHHLKIINQVDVLFTIAEEHNPLLQYIHHLDLSEVGTLHISDHGFRGFSQLNRLNISSTRTCALNENWFAIDNNIQVLDISRNTLKELKRNSFNTLHSLRTADLSHNEIESIENLAFSELKWLIHLDLRNNRLKFLVDWSGLDNLEELHLDENHLTQLPPNGFRSLVALNTLTLSENSINSIEEDCLNGLRNLQKLILSSNHLLKDIPNGLFRGFSDVRLLELDFSNNGLTSLAAKTFQNLKFLQFFDLSRNTIQTINVHAFEGLNSLRRLLLNNNYIGIIQSNTFGRLKKLDSLDLSGNSLKTFSGDLFGTTPKKLRKLFLKANHLENIEPHTFETIPNVDFLVLTDNAISALDENLLLPLQNLKKLHINHNLLDELSLKLFRTTERLQELYIDHNRFTYFPFAAASSELMNIKKLSVEGNPWQCDCFWEIMDWVTQRNITYSPYINKKYFDGSKPICVETQWRSCVNSVDETEKKQIIEKYMTALN